MSSSSSSPLSSSSLNGATTAAAAAAAAAPVDAADADADAVASNGVLDKNNNNNKNKTIVVANGKGGKDGSGSNKNKNNNNNNRGDDSNKTKTASNGAVIEGNNSNNNHPKNDKKDKNLNQQHQLDLISRYGAHVPEDKVQYVVRTPYGKGLTVRTRYRNVKTKDDVEMREIELLDWKDAAETVTAAAAAAAAAADPNGDHNNTKKNRTGSSANDPLRLRRRAPATLFTAREYPSVPPAVGCDVTCLYGRGRVLEVRRQQDDSGDDTAAAAVVVVVRLSSWRLARRSTVRCYLSARSVRVVRRKKIYEMDVYERIDNAAELKAAAAADFGRREYDAALETYSRAIDSVRYVQHKKDSTNYVRADLLAVMITCCNNAALCCTRTKRWDRAVEFAKNAVVLIEALEQKKDDSRIKKVLNEDGHPDARIFGEWKVKSYLCMARGMAEKHDTERALDALKKAREVIAAYVVGGSSDSNNGNDENWKTCIKHLQGQDKEVKKLHAVCVQRRKAEKKKERQRAVAMFGGGGGGGGSNSSSKGGDGSSKGADGGRSSSRSSSRKNGEDDAATPDVSRWTSHGTMGTDVATANTAKEKQQQQQPSSALRRKREEEEGDVFTVNNSNNSNNNNSPATTTTTTTTTSSSKKVTFALEKDNDNDDEDEWEGGELQEWDRDMTIGAFVVLAGCALGSVITWLLLSQRMGGGGGAGGGGGGRRR